MALGKPILHTLQPVTDRCGQPCALSRVCVPLISASFIGVRLRLHLFNKHVNLPYRTFSCTSPSKVYLGLFTASAGLVHSLHQKPAAFNAICPPSQSCSAVCLKERVTSEISMLLNVNGLFSGASLKFDDTNVDAVPLASTASVYITSTPL